MFIYEWLRDIKKFVMKRVNAKRPIYLSSVRRIDQVAPISGQRICAMTFDDGPNAAYPNPLTQNKGVTEIILDTMKKYKARGTFDVIGTTKENYPDKPGKDGSFSWSGVEFDHYPDFKKDELAGVVNQPELVQRMIDEGHELANHGYTHLLFGKMHYIYHRRRHFKNIDQVVEDLKKLDDHLVNQHNYKMKLARPPHYVDKIPDGFTSYDAYREMNYQYLAASFNGGGWMKTSGNYEKDVRNMVEPMKLALMDDPNSLNGQIIFQKDGCNMSRQTPVVDALAKQLELLTSNGYQVVTVSELLEMSPFRDVGDTDEIFPVAKALLQRGHILCYSDNTVRPNQVATYGEAAIMLSPPGVEPVFEEGDIAQNTPLTAKIFNGLLDKMGYEMRVDFHDDTAISRRDVLITMNAEEQKKDEKQ